MRFIFHGEMKMLHLGDFTNFWPLMHALLTFGHKKFNKI